MLIFIDKEENGVSVRYRSLHYVAVAFQEKQLGDIIC